jgi:hypothetical protein
VGGRPGHVGAEVEQPFAGGQAEVLQHEVEAARRRPDVPEVPWKMEVFDRRAVFLSPLAILYGSPILVFPWVVSLDFRKWFAGHPRNQEVHWEDPD